LRSADLRRRSVLSGTTSSSCSQILTTFHPESRSFLATRRSRFRLASSFCDQNLALFFGLLLHFGQQCQKHPSTKTATRSFRKAKSGRPNMFKCRLQPRIATFRSKLANRSSVARFPRDRIFDMTSDRFCFVKTSAIAVITP
jgi:hypothetical protein